MSDLQTLIEEGQRLLEAKPEMKSVEVTHFPPETGTPGAAPGTAPQTHKSNVVYSVGKKTHHYTLATTEVPKKGAVHTVHMTSPNGEPLVGVGGEVEPPIHQQAVDVKTLAANGGPQMHQFLVKGFTDRLHPVKPGGKGLVPIDTAKNELSKEAPKRNSLHPPKQKS